MNCCLADDFLQSFRTTGFRKNELTFETDGAGISNYPDALLVTQHCQNTEYTKINSEQKVAIITYKYADIHIHHVTSAVYMCCFVYTLNFQVTGSNLTAGHLKATLSKLLTYGVLRSTQPPTLRGTGNGK